MTDQAFLAWTAKNFNGEWDNREYASAAWEAAKKHERAACLGIVRRIAKELWDEGNRPNLAGQIAEALRELRDGN